MNLCKTNNKSSLRRLIRPLLTLLLLAATLLTLSCKQEESAPEYAIDPAVLAEQLATELKFDDTLVALTTEATALKFPYGQASAFCWAGSGATAEIVLAAAYPDPAAAEAALPRFEAYLDSQANLFATYNAAEVPKIESAVCSAFGRWIVMTVCPDPDAALAIIQQFEA